VARGRPPAFTREQVVDAAIALADAEGLAAVTFRRVAAQIGAGAMSLYTYVADKDRLIDLMVDRVAAGVSWPAGLLDLAVAQRELMLRHPWLPGALPNRRLTGTNMLAYLEHGLAALAPTGLAGRAKLEIVALLTGFVASYVTNEQAQAAAGAVTTGEQVELITEAVASGDFPHLATALAEQSGGVPGFEELTARMIAGLTAPPRASSPSA
jgi:AcrR family transcriptional regulator